MTTIGAKLKKLFFDAPGVSSAMDRATFKVFQRFGAIVRSAARGSIKPGAGVSAPGNPPLSHTGSLRNAIRYFVDHAVRSVIIGPLKLNGKRGGDAPALLEHGGRSRLVAKGRGGRPYHPRYRARPFMGPAFSKSQSKLPALWANSIKTK